MIDTIKLVSREYNKNHKLDLSLDKVIRYGSTNKEFEYYSYRNFTIMLSENKMTIQGSLTKFLVGHNINLKLGSLKDVRDSFESMKRDMGIDIESFRVARLDFGKCFLLPEPVNIYLERILALQRHRSIIYDNTGRYFQNSIRSLLFYDKKYHTFNIAKKDKKVNEKTIEILQIHDENILRYEYQIKEPKKHYGKEIYVSDLLDEDFYNNVIIRDFSKLFNKIDLRSDCDIPNLRAMSPKEIKATFQITIFTLNYCSGLIV